MESFRALGIDEDGARAMEAFGFAEPTQVQSAAIPHVLAGADLLIESETGTGKTIAYLLPLLQRIGHEGRKKIVVVSPTHELAAQIAHVAESIMKASGKDGKALIVIGSIPLSRLEERLKQGPRVVVGTPMRLAELDSEKRYLSDAAVLVLDEADRLAQREHFESTKALIARCPKERQSLLVSATLGEEAIACFAGYLKEPLEVRLASSKVLTGDIDHAFARAELRDKLDTVRRACGALPFKRAILFASSQAEIVNALAKLSHMGIGCAPLHAKGDKRQRASAIKQFAEGKIRLLIASDIAARGLDIPDVDCVFHLDLPQSQDAYKHRAGRCGRMGRKGLSIALVDPYEEQRLSNMARKLGIVPRAVAFKGGGMIDDDGQPPSRPHRASQRAGSERKAVDNAARPRAQGQGEQRPRQQGRKNPLGEAPRMGGSPKDARNGVNAPMPSGMGGAIAPDSARKGRRKRRRRPTSGRENPDER
jgi:superfamily II DNA/RNA helicase